MRNSKVKLDKKVFFVTIFLLLSFNGRAADTEIVKSKDWQARKIETHKVSSQQACVASTQIKGKDVTLEVYSEFNVDGGFVQPMVQIVTTQFPTALGVVLKPSPSGKEMPMSISLKETKIIEVEVLEQGSNVPVLKKMEQQVFVGKFKDKKELVDLIRAKNSLKATFVGQSGTLGQENFSLGGSNLTIKTMLSRCL